jgi:hypothetical protein
MNPTQDKYPHFETNQVLTNTQLNEVFDYLNEQERLTRSNLIGIGIECGLSISLSSAGGGKVIRLEKGAGVSSEGYLIIEPVAVELSAYQEYTLPLQIDYSPFRYTESGKVKQYPLWELFPAGIKNTKPLGTPADFLTDKAVILFLELRQEGLHNCSTNNCDDKGSEVTATVRRLLIRLSDLNKILSEAAKLGSEYSYTDVEASLFARLHLPDLRVPRHILPDSAVITSNQVFASFLRVFQAEKLAATTGAALSAAYQAFRPLLAKTFPDDPFASFVKKFGSLDRVPAATSQIRFLQYYCDFFDDLVQAYDEFRWKGFSLMCACLPPSELFPRHLMLGALDPVKAQSPGMYRHHFLPSAAISDCEDKALEVRQLFLRLVEMVNHFTDNPTPPDFSNKEIARKLMPIRVTPSKYGDEPLSEKAIPYYYLNQGNPPLYQLWNVSKTQRYRANQNLGFRSDEYIPEAPSFVKNPLNYNFEPFNFFRVEGHLGKNVKSALSTLLALKTRYRLPVEFIALRTGVFDPRMPVDLSKEQCRFEDLEALYDALRDELVSSLGKTLASFYSKKVIKPIKLADGFRPRLISGLGDNYQLQPSTFGALIESYFANRNIITATATAGARTNTLARLRDVFINESPIIRATASFAEVLLEIKNFLTDRPLSEFDIAAFEQIYNDLRELNDSIKSDPANGTGEWNELFNQLEAVHYANQLESFRSIASEYRRRLLEVKKKQFLGYFAGKNPGLQHKAGVPVGGTFILIYHDDPTPPKRRYELSNGMMAAKENVASAGFSAATTEAITNAFMRIQTKADEFLDPDIQLIISEFTKGVPLKENPGLKGERYFTADKIISQTVNEFADGTVIADFFLPYICCSDCSPIQYVLPKDPLIFNYSIGCANADGQSKIIVTPAGGVPPYQIKINTDDFTPLPADLFLPSGAYALSVRDTEGTTSDVTPIVVPETLKLGEPSYDCVGDGGEYIAVMNISGGTPPYQSDWGTVDGNSFVTKALPGDQDTEVMVSDSKNCQISTKLSYHCEPPCTLPCDGNSADCAYRLWLQPPAADSPYTFYDPVGTISLQFNGESVPMPAAADVLKADFNDLNKDFKAVMTKLIAQLNETIQKQMVKKLGKDFKNRLVLSYQPAGDDPFATLRMETFVCESFELIFSIKFGKQSSGYMLTWKYSSGTDASGAEFKGSVTTNAETKKDTVVPAFACQTRNQCSGTDFVKTCQINPLEPSFTIKKLENGNYRFESTTKGAGQKAWIWDILNASSPEPFYQGATVDVSVPKPFGLVRLTVTDQNGCFRNKDDNFKL